MRQWLIHGNKAVNNFHLVIVVNHDNQIDEQLPNGVKANIVICSFLCLEKRFKTVHMCMYVSFCSNKVHVDL